MTRKPTVEIIEDELVENLRRKTPAQRLAVAFDMWRFAHNRLDQMLRQQHPDWDQKQLQSEIRRRMLGST